MTRSVNRVTMLALVFLVALASPEAAEAQQTVKGASDASVLAAAGISPDVLTRALRERETALVGCGLSLSFQRTMPPSGLDVRFVIDPSGRVLEARVREETKRVDRPLHRCVRHALAQMILPARLGTESVSVIHHVHIGANVIKHVIQSNIDSIRACYEQGLESDPELRGRVAVRFIISPSGTVEIAALAQSSLDRGDVEACIVEAVRTLVFPAPNNGVPIVVTYPFVLDTRP